MKYGSPRPDLIMKFLEEFKLAHNGCAPTIREIGAGVEISSTSVVNYNLNVLERHGRIIRGGEYESRMIQIPGSRWTKEPSMPYRYLVYSIDKHQSSPRFTNQGPVDFISGYDVVVDLAQGRRLFYGDWQPVAGFDQKESINEDDKIHRAANGSTT